MLRRKILVSLSITTLIITACAQPKGVTQRPHVAAPVCGWQQVKDGFALQIGTRRSTALAFAVVTTDSDLPARLDTCVDASCYYGSQVGTLKVSLVKRKHATPPPMRGLDEEGKAVWIDSHSQVDTLQFLFQPNTDVTIVGWRSLPLVIPGEAASNPAMFHEGFQAGTFAGWERVPDMAWEPSSRLWANDNEDKWTHARPGTSWWHTAVTLADRTLVLGSAASLTRTTQSWMRLRQGRLEFMLRTGIEGEQLSLSPGSSTKGEPWLAFCDASAGQAMEHLGTIAADITPRRTWPYRQIGWSSWYYYYNDFRGTDLQSTLQNLSTLAERSQALSGQPPLIQVDDGWEAKWGQWQTSVEKGFGNDLTALATLIREAGGRPGLWLAPLHVDTDLPWVTQHPDWWLRDPTTGKLERLRIPTLPDRYILDLSNREVQQYLEDLFEMLGRAGFGYLKIDFLHDALRAAKRTNERLTPVQWFKIFLTRIRLAAERGYGGPVFFLASLAPIMPIAGLVNAVRVGPDVAYEIGRKPFWPWTLTEYRTVASRAWLHNVFAVDPDNLIVRGLSAEEEGMSFWGNIAAGGSLLYGDALNSGSQPAGWKQPLRAEAISRTTGTRILDLTDAALPSPIANPSTWLTDSDVPGCWELLGSNLLVAFGWRLDQDTECFLPGAVLTLVEGKGVVSQGKLSVEHGSYAVARIDR